MFIRTSGSAVEVGKEFDRIGRDILFWCLVKNGSQNKKFIEMIVEENYVGMEEHSRDLIDCGVSAEFLMF